MFTLSLVRKPDHAVMNIVIPGLNVFSGSITPVDEILAFPSHEKNPEVLININ